MAEVEKNDKEKFWTMDYRKNTPKKMVIVLMYAFLEWILIGLLFLDGIFSYLISAFAEFFGLDPPCFLCSRALGAKLHYCSRHADHTCEVEEEEEDDDGEEEYREMMAVVEDSSMDDSIILISRTTEVEERLIPLELVDSSTKSDFDNAPPSIREQEDEEEAVVPVVESSTNSDVEAVNLSILSRNDNGDDNSLMIARDREAEAAFVPVVESMEDSNLEYVFRSIPMAESMEEEEKEEEAFGEFQAAAEEEEGKTIDVEANCEISIGSEICDEEHIDLPHSNEPAIPPITDDDVMDGEEEDIPELTVSVVGHMDETLRDGLINEGEEERMPETPNSVESLHSLHKKFLFERREFGTESLDGSVASEIDGSEILTVDRLKAALKVERTALTALYAELEEERNASAIAANQTMAMITRLQGEKAAMQMEALQYQRMMEEQSEYDQEALQLLNELMMKREKEKQELEKELEAYRKKVYNYEAKERRMSRVNGRSGSSSGSLSADESNIDISSESRDGEDHQSTPTCDVLSFAADQHLISLDDSLADFEEERTSILEQLKALEEKLFSLEDDDNMTSVGFGHNFTDANVHGANGDYESCEHDVNVGEANGFVHDLDTNVKFHHEPSSVPSSGKRLLPLFDATVGMESDDGLSNGSPDSFFKSAIDNQKKLAIAEEVDNVYERLQALETDREFLKHCISSLNKGDKGMDLLQEILQHLRGLRNVQLRVRNAGYALASLSA